MRTKFLLVMSASFALVSAAVPDEKPFANGVVPDEKTAIAVAEAILFRAYGKERIASERPYKVSLTDGEWYIFGSLPEDPTGAPVTGGVFRIVISQNNGCVRSYGHDE